MSNDSAYLTLEHQILALQESDSLKQSLLDSSIDMIMRYDPDLTITWANRTAAAMVDKLPSEIIGSKCYRLFQRREEPCPGCPCIKALETKRPVTAIMHQAAMETVGESYWENHAVPQTDGDGRVVAIAEIARNVTERVVAEKKLRASEQRFQQSEAKYRDLLEASPAVILAVQGGSFVYCNPAGARLMGFADSDDVLGKMALKAIVPDQRRDVYKRIRRLEKGYPEETMELELLRPDGMTVFLESSSVPIMLNGKRAALIIGVDVTRKKEAEKRIKDSEKKFRLLFEHIPDAVVLLDLESLSFVEFNERAHSLFGYTRRQFAQLSLTDLEAEQSRAEIDKNIGKLITGETLTFATRKRRRDGEIRDILVRTRAMPGNGRKLALNIWRDITERKRYESQLRESEERYRALFETAGDAIFVADPRTGILLDANLKAEELTGYSRSELIGRHQSDLHPREEAKIYREKFKDAVERRGKRFLETEIVHKNGQRIPVEISSGGKVRAGGRDVHFGIFRNITRRMAAEAEIRFQAMILDQIQDRVTATDVDGTITYVNEAQCRTLKRNRSELVGQPVTVFGEDRQRGAGQEEILRETLEKGQWRGEVVNISGEGNGIILDCRTQTIKDDCGRVIGLSGISTDITEMKRAEEQLKNQFRFVQKLIDAIPVSVFYKNREGVYLGCNESYAQFLGLAKEDIIGKTVFDLFPKDLAAVYNNRDRRLFAEPGFQQYEGQMLHRDGTRHDVMFSKATYEDDNGRVMGIVGGVLDMTETRRAEKEKSCLENQLRQIQKMEAIGALAGGIAHDFNNLLFPIIGLSELLLESMEPDDPHRLDIGEILRAARRAGDLVKQILTFSRQSERKRIPVRVQPILDEAVKLSRATIPVNIKIRTAISHDCGQIMADPTHLHQVVMNLVTNAYHAVEEQGGRIVVGLEKSGMGGDGCGEGGLRAGSYACLTVSDNGCGIKKSHMTKIFEPYFTTKEPGKGTGLGLSVVHGIVKDYEGEIRVVSEEGRGTTFFVYLPLLEGVAAYREQAGTAYSLRGSEKILIVDDEEIIVTMEKRMLESLGYRVSAWTNSVEAFAAFKKDPHEFDLVITDMTMPQLTGDRLAWQVKKIRSRIPVIVCTGFSEKLNPVYIAALGIERVVLKPVIKEELAKVIREVLDRV